MNFLKKLININNSEGTRESMKDSYEKHFHAAQGNKIPLSGGTTPHLAGLYGALSTRYISANIPRHEVQLWSELTPFILMSKDDSVKALAEYVVCIENPKDRQREDWLKNLINKSLRNIETTDKNYIAMAASAITQMDIYWLNLLDTDVRELLEREREKLNLE
ncbi:MAG: hypothetical protein KAI57_04570 [Candidatus Pacebacteria bacterium]|nr:hypothetical protein [Candidatus Paceibacterota bacterium]